MVRLVGLVFLTLVTSGCAEYRSGKAIFLEDSEQRYVELRKGQAGYVSVAPALIEGRPELKEMREVHGDLDFICRELNGPSNPRIVVESKDKSHYEVVSKWEDRDALGVVAKALDLSVAEEERTIPAMTIRVSAGGHRMRPAAPDEKCESVDKVYCDDEGRWPLNGVTIDEFALFLESRYRRPVVNLTEIKGRWSIVLSAMGGKSWPNANEKRPLDDLGLEVQWENIKLPVIVVKDLPKNDGK